MAEQALDEEKQVISDCIDFAVRKLGIKEVPQEHEAVIKVAVSDAVCYIRKGTLWGDDSPLWQRRMDPQVRAFLDCTVDWFLPRHAEYSCDAMRRLWIVYARVNPRD